MVDVPDVKAGGPDRVAKGTVNEAFFKALPVDQGEKAAFVGRGWLPSDGSAGLSSTIMPSSDRMMTGRVVNRGRLALSGGV